MNEQEKGEVPESRAEKVRQYAIVSKRALETDHIGYCYRETPENNIDSGWRFLYGDEDDEYLSNPTNNEAVYPDDMLSINPSIDVILSAPVNTEFEWDDELEAYVEVVTD
jgi:Uncharacterized protein conserved in bacteria